MNYFTKERIPVLDGLRFLAAFSVLLAHYSAWVVGDQGIHNKATEFCICIAGFGMPLFFVLSGFVIHFNYHQIHQQPGGIKSFLIARFTRLYPLYILIFVIEFVITFRLHRGSCGHAGEKWALLAALPYYLSLTQDWVFGIIGKNNLIYQYHMATAVSWSISLEVFFYLFYLLLGRWLVKQHNLIKQILFILIAQLTLAICILFLHRHSEKIEHIALVGFGPYATTQHGYQDSLLRWLFYFNPLINLPAFFFGTVISNIYLNRNKTYNKLEQTFSNPFSFLSIILACAFFLYLYVYLAPTNGLIGRSASLWLALPIALMIYCLVRFSSSIPSRFLSNRLFVKLGEASYSIYLLHAFFGWYPRDFYYLKLNPWVLYALSILCILIISRCSYVLFERPVQRWLRKKMMKESSAVVTENSIIKGWTK